MCDKCKIEEAIKILNRFKTIKILYDNIFVIQVEDLEKLQQAIENVLADRERLEKILKKSDANNIELQKEIEVLKNDTYWKGYIDKQNEAIEICKICKYKAKANNFR